MKLIVPLLRILFLPLLIILPGQLGGRCRQIVLDMAKMNELSVPRKLRMMIHVLGCKSCWHYKGQMDLLESLVDPQTQLPTDEQIQLSSARIKEKVLKKLK